MVPLLLAGHAAALDQWFDQLFELGPREVLLQMFRAGGVHGDERQADAGLLRRGKLDLGLLSGFLEPLQGHLILMKIDADPVFRERTLRPIA